MTEAQLPVCVAALYKFTPFADPAAIQGPLAQLCAQLGLRGTLLLAREGINGTIAGLPDDIRNILDYLHTDPLFAGKFSDLEHKESYADEHPFYRMKVKLKKEIVTFGVHGVSPTNMVGT